MNLPDNMTLKATVSRPGAGSGTGSKQKKSVSWSDRFSWPGRIALLIAVVLSPWAFASVQHWAQQWITILLLIGLAFWWFETAVNSRHKQVVPYLFFLVLLGLGIGLFQIIPLPAWLSELVLGRQTEIYQSYTGDPDPSLTVSLDREQTWHQIRLLIIAISGLLLGARYFRTKRDVVLLMSVVAANGVLISFFGIIHKLTDNGKMFWVHEVVSGGLPFGPFVNRNNAAGYLLMALACSVGLVLIAMSKRKKAGPKNIISKEIPFWRQLNFQLLEFISELTARKLAVLMAVVLIATAIISSISRGGVVAMLVAAMGTILVYGVARRPKNSGFVVLPLILLVFALTGWVGFGDQLAERFEKIDMVNVTNTDVRIKHWKDTWPAVGDMGWFGSGLGSYRNVHRLYRQDQENVLFAYAENQYFQALVESGWPGLILFLLAWVLAYRYVAMMIFQGSSPTSIGIGAMGVFLVLSQAVASIFDFGFYIPANLLLLSVLFGFIGYHAHALAIRLKKRSWLQYQFPNVAVQAMVLVLFAGATIVAIDLHRRAEFDGLMKPRAVDFDRENMDLETTNQRIADLSQRIGRSPTVKSCNYAGELMIHRSRLMLFDSLVESVEENYQNSLLLIGDGDRTELDQDKAALIENLWILTELPRAQENVSYYRRTRQRGELESFLTSFRKNLPAAENFFLYSRSVSPLQPLVHLRLGEVRSVLGGEHAGDEDFERALSLAPGNANFRFLVGVYYLQVNNREAAVPHLRKFLELLPGEYSKLMALVTGGVNRDTGRLDDQVIAEQIIPDDPKMLYEFATKYMSADSPARQQVLQRAGRILKDESRKRREFTILMGDIYLAQGKLADSEQQYQLALISQPNDPKTRYKRARILFDLGRFKEAYEEALDLRGHDHQNSTYNKLLEEVESELEKQDRDQRP